MEAQDSPPLITVCIDFFLFVYSDELGSLCRAHSVFYFYLYLSDYPLRYSALRLPNIPIRIIAEKAFR